MGTCIQCNSKRMAGNYGTCLDCMSSNMTKAFGPDYFGQNYPHLCDDCDKSNKHPCPYTLKVRKKVKFCDCCKKCSKECISMSDELED